MNSAQITDLLSRAEQYAQSHDLSLSTVSRKLLNDGKGLSRLKTGGQLTLKTLDAAFEKLALLEADTKTADAPVSGKSGPSSDAPGQLITKESLTHLDRLEAESIHIMREVAAEAENPVMLYSVGKDSAVMLHLAMKAFYPTE